LVIYLSGYAVEINGHPYYIPVDGIAGKPQSYVDLSEVQRAISGTFGRRILMIDSCGVELTRSLKTTLLDDNRDDQVAILAAALPSQVAFERAELQHGLFTYSLIRGLLGDARRPGRAEVTFADLGDFVTREVEKLSHGRQTPFYTINDRDQSNFVLSIMYP